MAGIEDHCPKCNQLVTAPTPKDPPAALELPQQVLPPPAEPSTGLINTLLDEFLSGPSAAETTPDPVAKPQKKSKAKQPLQEVTPELAPVVPAMAESPLASDPGPIEVAAPSGQPLVDTWNEPPADTLPDIGMGDALGSYLNPPAINSGRQITPSLGVGLVQVSDMPRTHRRTRKTRALITGLLLFLMLDAAVLWVFRHRIQEWLTRDSTAKVKKVATHPADDQAPPAPEKKETPPPDKPAVEPPTVVMPKPSIAPEVATPPETLTNVSLPPAPPAVAPIEPTPIKLPDVSTELPLVVAKVEIETPPLPPPAPVITDSSPPSVAPPVTTPSPADFSEVATAKSALEALKAFLAASSISERLRWCQKPDVVRPLMEKHYTSHADGPVKVGRIDLIDRYPSKDGVPPYSMFEVSGGSLKKAVLALVEEKPKNEFRVDWENFVEFKDGLLWEFMTKPGSRAQKFRMIIRRTHYFDKDVPDVANKDGFEISQPSSDMVGHVFIERSSPIARQLAQRLGWDGKIPVTLELVWRADGTHHWVEIQTLSSLGWRG